MAKGAKGLTASSKAIDPTLDALFSSSAGRVQAPPTSRYSALVEKKPREEPKPKVVVLEEEDHDDDADEDDDEVLSEISEELSYGEENDENESDGSDDEAAGEDSDASKDEDATDEPMADVPVELDAIIEAAEGEKPKKDRKRKRKDDNDDLEDKYLKKLTADEPAGKRPKGDAARADVEVDGGSNEDEDKIPVHESLAKDSNTSDIEKAGRTVFLANVSTEAISSKTAKKTLMAHLASILDKDASPPQTLESIRFRSIAFSGGALPKRAAFITKSLMEATTKSANAYVVYSTNVAAREAVAKLNGTVVLDRHLRVDSVAHPSPTDHRRCLFVGNLGFVDDESILDQDEEGETKKKKRNKVPSDIEEGLWRTFGKHGRVENVRVVRDPKTRVGKGFAYVQFYDANDVEAALLLDQKKFPPLLPRILRVTRAKDPRKTATAVERSKAKSIAANAASKSTKYTHKATPEQLSLAGRTGKLLGRSAAYQQRQGKRPSRNDALAASESAGVLKTPEQVVFEGRRASSKDGRPKDLKLGKKGKGKSGRPQNRGARRAAAWKKSK